MSKLSEGLPPPLNPRNANVRPHFAPGLWPPGSLERVGVDSEHSDLRNQYGGTTFEENRIPLVLEASAFPPCVTPPLFLIYGSPFCICVGPERLKEVVIDVVQENPPERKKMD